MLSIDDVYRLLAEMLNNELISGSYLICLVLVGVVINQRQDSVLISHVKG